MSLLFPLPFSVSSYTFFWPHDEYIADIIAFNTTYVLHVNKYVKYGYQIQEFNINIFI